jgi:predicted AlkP superfamily phosphohydrolase/phosphomutase
MTVGRLLIAGLDGYEHSFGRELIARGRMPALATLIGEGASMALDHGPARETGLGWEHFATGLDPRAARRWGAVNFDPQYYRVEQRSTALPPFVTGLGLKSVVFDAPYFDLRRAPDVAGLVGWGAHDPGVANLASPPGLAREVAAKFGSYPAAEFIYGFTWPSAERTRRAAAALVRAVDVRAAVGEWLLGTRLPDWQLGLVVVGEFHSAIEPFWHGVDPGHPLHALPSAGLSRDGLERVYVAADRLIGRLRRRFPDAGFAIVSMHGMGANSADVPAMALLPELLFRRQFRRIRLKPRDWRRTAAGVPLLAENASWEREMRRALLSPADRIRRRLAALARRAVTAESADPVDWMPASLYRRWWPLMDAFALPAYYDGRIRINLAGREHHGRVPMRLYDETCAALCAMLEQCRDPLSGERVVARIDRASRPEAESGSGADLHIAWRPGTLGLIHPELGQVGPLPYRRTGGHTGDAGFAAIAAPGIEPRSLPRISAFDIVPTLLDLLGRRPPARLSGRSIAEDLRGPRDAAQGDRTAAERGPAANLLA